MAIQDRKNATGPGGSTVVTPLRYISEGQYDGSGNLIYWGIADPGSAVGAAAWFIRRFDYDGSGNLLDVLFANGSRNFDQAWTARAGLAYS